MPSLSRRQLLRRSAGMALGVAASGAAGAATPRRPRPGGSPGRRPAIDDLPPHRPLELPDLHAYADRVSVAAGESIRFHVSSDRPYRMSVCRLGPEVDDPAADETIHRAPGAPARAQPIHPGSYVHVPRGLEAGDLREGLTLECWLRPWRLDARQGVLTQFDRPDRCGLGLFLDEEGRLTFYLGDGGAPRREALATGPRLQPRRWQHVVGTWDGSDKSLWVDGRRVGRWATRGPVAPGRAPLRLGAAGGRSGADDFLDGDLAMTALYGRALSGDEIASRHRARGLRSPAETPLLACWDFAEEGGSALGDRGPAGRDGRVVNEGTWMIGGPTFTDPDRYSDYDPASDPDRGHGLRLASDDLYDCRWEPGHEVRIPEDARPGIYVGRFRWERDGEEHLYDVVFVVRRHPGRPRAPVLLLCATSTWRAYSTTPFAEHSPGVHQVWGPRGRPGDLADAPGPGFSFYRDHAADQPTYKMGMRMPWPAAAPYVVNQPREVGFSHLTRAERFTQVWLERGGYDVDLASDLDLHRDPSLLEGREVVIVNGHSEYWTADSHDALDAWLEAGGDVVALSGNTMFWRVSFDDEARVMECRKYGTTVAGQPEATFGETWHEQDGRQGGLMRECGHPAWRVLGLECLGWWGTGATDFGIYRVETPDHFLLGKLRDSGPGAGDTFGHAAHGGVPRAVGHEGDVRLATLRRMTPTPLPEGADLPEEPEGIVTLARGVRAIDDAVVFDYFARPAETFRDTYCEMIYWERPRGGRVFHAGAVAAGWALEADPRLGDLLRDVLAHFGVEARRDASASTATPGVGTDDPPSAKTDRDPLTRA